MDFIDELRQFSSRVEKIKDVITTEEATKNSLILPFFQLLGYDVFNPLDSRSILRMWEPKREKRSTMPS